MKQNEIIFRALKSEMEALQHANDKFERRQQMRNTGIMESKHEGKKMYSLRNTNQTTATR